jgi:hypothetical protein
MDMLQINQLRKNNQIPFNVLNWLEKLNPMVEHDDFGKMYKGSVLAEDIYGKYAAIVGTTDQLLRTPLETIANRNQYKILKIENFW